MRKEKIKKLLETKILRCSKCGLTSEDPTWSLDHEIVKKKKPKK